MSAKKANAEKTSGIGSVAAVPAALAQPVVDTSRRISGHVTGHIQWYLEQWENLVVEAKAERAGAGTDLAGILAGLAQAKVLSEFPGQVRLRVRQLKGHEQLAWQTLEALANVRGVRRAEVSAVTGSILIVYDTAVYPSRDALLQAVAAT